MPQFIRTPGRARTAFTLVELLVVLAIMAVLIALVSAAVIMALGTMQGRATDSTLEKTSTELDKQWKVVVEQAGREPVPANVVTLAGGDPHRARVIWVKLRLGQEFPISYAEARSPIPAALLQANGGPLAPNDLPPKNIYVKNLPAAANIPATESSACLLLAPTQGRGGMRWDAENTLGAGSVLDTDGDGAREILDSWGNALYFVRVPFSNPDLNPPSGTMKAGANDAQDPDGLLNNPTWATSPYGKLFSASIHPVAANSSWQNLSPVVASPGPDKTIGTNDDHFSYRLKSAGSGGQR